MSEPISKGIFWFICGFNEMDECDFSETELIAFPVSCDRDGRVTGDWDFNSRRENAYNHKKTWTSFVKHRKDLRKYGWNYFPRGRVEIRRGKAVIFMNPCILSCENFQEKLVERFHLEGMKVRVAADCSRHYRCYGDARNMGQETADSIGRRKQSNDRKCGL